MRYLSALISAAFVVAAWPASAEETEKGATPWETFSLNLGVFVAEAGSDVRLGVPAVGIDIDVEDTLGFDTTTVAFRTDAFWRFTKNKRHRVDFNWFALNRDGSATLFRDLEIGGTTFPTGSTVQSKLDLDLFKGAYSYSFIQDDRIDLAASVGLYVAPFSFDIASQGAFTGRVAESITAPLPVVGLRADVAITPKWFLRSSFNLFYLSIDGYTGFITDVQVAAEYKAFKYVGFGLGVDALHLEIEAEKGTDVPGVDFTGKFGFEYVGVYAYTKFYID